MLRFIKKTFVINIIGLIIIFPSLFFMNQYFAKSNQNAFNQNKPTERILKTSKQADLNPTINPGQIVPECIPSKYNFSWDIIQNGKSSQSFMRKDKISFQSSGDYTKVQGVVTFRGNNYRDSASFGFVNVKEQKLSKAWSIKIKGIDGWTGVGWNGQPAIIKWDDKVKKIMNINPSKKLKNDLKEVIYATLDGNIYFIDLDNGEATRPPISVGFPHKGSVSVDARGYPLLYAGQGINQRGNTVGEFGYRIFSLIDQKKLFFINGLEKYAYRKWGAFDSTSLLDTKTDTMIECGENGILYSLKLNTNFNPDKKSISINPEVVRYRYKSPVKGELGTENSVVTYKNLAYFVNNSGTLQCLDLNTLSPVWIRNVTDDTDGTMALEEEGDKISLYTACEVDKQGKNGYSYVRKIDALTGKLLWQKSYKCILHKTNGGALASPVVGKNDIKNLIIYNIAKTDKGVGGKLIAFDKKTGKEVWVVNLDRYCWSSPVSVYTKTGKSYIVQCDSVGNMFLFDGLTGKQLHKINLGANVEGSPAVYDNMIVVGTRGKRIWGIKIS